MFFVIFVLNFSDIIYRQCVCLKNHKINLEIIDISTRPVSNFPNYFLQHFYKSKPKEYYE